MKKLIFLIFFLFACGLTYSSNAQTAYTYYAYFDEWDDIISLGPASFDLNNPGSQTLLTNQINWEIPYKGVWAENAIYCTDEYFYGFFKIDPVAISQTYINQPPFLGFYIHAISYDVTTNTMFLVEGSSFYKLNISTGAYNYIADVGHWFRTLACDGEGELYAGFVNGIYHIDKYTGNTTLITNSYYFWDYDCWEFDRDNNILYWMSGDNTNLSETTILFKLNPNTGETTFKGFVGHFGDTAYSTEMLAIPYTPKPLAVPNLLSPANLSSGISLTPTLDWDDVPNATKYTLQASLSRDFTTPLLNIENLTVSQYSIPDSMPLSRNTQYFWRVKAFNDAGDSTSWWSTKFRFRTIGNSISGTLTYNNQAGTPLTNCTLSLKDSTGTTIAQTTSDSTGFYNFNSVYHGTYTIEASTDKSWGGLNMIDASLTRQKIAFLTEFTPLQTTAADVNLSNSVNMIDVALMRQKIAFLNPPQWLIPNYIFEKPTVVVYGFDVTVNIKALCAGDVNGSFIPSE